MNKRIRRSCPLSGKMTRIGGRVVAAVAVTSLMGGGVLAATENAAVAGTNGQQIHIDQGISFDTLELQVCGHNQNNDLNCGPWFSSPYHSPKGVTGRWYKGYISINWQDEGAIGLDGLETISGTWKNLGPVPTDFSGSWYTVTINPAPTLPSCWPCDGSGPGNTSTQSPGNGPNPPDGDSEILSEEPDTLGTILDIGTEGAED